ncbi:uncharacterized protein N7503_005272 [Penicillium pulvis]|uniref:uncharacterized protein n=1 Tax=Penicillium pulvis TaxID=1562058 RepID=UPI0025471997|nr:uncharacterized protein N7503_005272 [Penicillium pulvis]KAJ5802822.1 hypothetical protein N7503_005272 [Penicillium pulvis]
MPPRKLPKGYVEVEESPFQPLVPHNPYLPPIPIKASFGYGSQFGTTMPRRLPAPPPQKITNLRQIAESVNQALENSQLRAATEVNAQKKAQKMPQGTAKPTPKKRQPAESVRRRTKREPTPDETQLHRALREATMTPTKEESNQSDSTPSPPIQRTVSTDSSPGAEPPLPRRLSVMSNSPNSPLYPSALQRGGHDTHETNSSGRWSRQSSIDNASVVSWNLERDIHEDDLKRTRPSTHGRNITAPPRRPSGLSSILPSTIDEEEEEGEEEEEYGDDELISEHPNEPKSEIEAEPMDGSASPAGGWTTSVRTIIPQFFRSEPSVEPPELVPPEDLAREWHLPARPATQVEDVPSKESKRTNWGRLAIMLLLPLALAISFQMGLWEKLEFPHFPAPIQYSPNATDSVAVHGLKDQVSKMNEQMSSLSRELVAVRSEHARDSSPTYAVGVPAGYESPIHKINFLSLALGAIVDPHQTTPTADRSYPFYQRVVLTMLGLRSTITASMPPVAALIPWEEVGDCWCSAPRNGVSQISVLLGRDIVPEEVVVEHVPSGSTLDPGAAPREIEVWARYRVIPLPFQGSSSIFSWWKSTPRRPIEPMSSRDEGLGGYSIPGEDSLHEVLMNSLSATNMYDPESAYSDDPLLGPNFYRIGKMVYDINKHNNVQRFHLNTIIDIPTIRVDKVAFRVKSNWGSNHTCIYRFKLHGHI